MKPFMPLLRNVLLVALLALSASMASVAADFCWKDTQTRGVGTIPKSCTDGKEYKDGLCYTPCKAGMNGVGPVCWSACPAGYIDMGAICHIDKALLKPGTWVCTDRGLFDECWWGYMQCDADYTNIGLLCALTPTSTPAGFSGTYLDPMKNTYGRGAGTIPTACAAGQQYDAGLCYDNCPQYYSGVGPVCWMQTPETWVGCGMGAASSGGKCAEAIFDQVSSVGEVAINIATLGAGNAATKPLKFARLKEAYQAAKKANKNFGKAAEAAEKAGETAYAAQGSVRTRLGILETTSSGEELSDMDLVALAANVASLADPSGVSGIIGAYTHPKCSALGLGQVPVQPPKPPEPEPPKPLCYCEESEKKGASSSPQSNYCKTWPTGSKPGETCKYTEDMRRHFHLNSNPYPGVCDVTRDGTSGDVDDIRKENPLCFGPERSPRGCHEFDCLIPGNATDLTAVINGTSAVISFKAPVGGSAPIDYYEAADSAGGFVGNFLKGQATASPITVTGLTAGVAYQFVIFTFNKKRVDGTRVNSTKFSPPSNIVGIPLPPSTNSVRPSPPTISGVEPGLSKGEVYVIFELFNDGGSKVTEFSTTCHTYDKNGVDRSASGLTSPLTVKGLIPGSLYQCSVQATNKYGTSSIDSHSLSKPVKAP